MNCFMIKPLIKFNTMQFRNYSNLYSHYIHYKHVLRFQTKISKKVKIKNFIKDICMLQYNSLSELRNDNKFPNYLRKLYHC